MEIEKTASPFGHTAKIMLGVMIIFIAFAFCLSSVSALFINTFNDSKTQDNISLTAGIPVIKYLSIPKNNIVTNAYLNLTGLNTSTICYQETTNKTNINDINCSLAYNGTYSDEGGAPFNSIKLLYDGDWTTLSECTNLGSACYMRANYIKPIYATGANVTAKNILGTYTAEIPSDCWNYNKTQVSVSLRNNAGTVGINCVNSTALYGERQIVNIGGDGAWYEEGINWTVFSYPLNPSMTIGVDNAWAYTGIFDKSNNKTNNLGNTIIGYLLDNTYLVGDNYLIPFTFISDMPSTLKYSDIRMDNEGIVETLANPDDLSAYISCQDRDFSCINLPYETENVNFQNIFLYDSSRYIERTYFNYNGTSYLSQNINNLTNDYIWANNSIDIPSITNVGENKNFWWIINLYEKSNGTTFNLTSTKYNQTINKLTFSVCNSTLTSAIFNFTFKEQTNFTNLNVSLTANFNYWLGEGTVKKSYIFLNPTVNRTNVSFCINPAFGDYENNKIDLDLTYSNPLYISDSYYLRDYTANIRANNTLYLLLSGEGTLFKIIVQKQTKIVPDAIVLTSRYFTSDGTWKNISSKITDAYGSATEYLKLGEKYKFYVTIDGITYEGIEEIAQCQATPCEIDLFINPETGNIFTEYSSLYATDVSSNLTFNSTTKTVTYDFKDNLGLASYFRLEVKQMQIGSAVTYTVCDTTVNNIAGTITCNVSDYEGDFMARGYILRGDKEKLDKEISFTITGISKGFGKMGLIFILAIILTFTFAGAVVSRGNPTVVLIFLDLALIGTKMMGIMPFSWVLVGVLSLFIACLAMWLRT